MLARLVLCGLLALGLATPAIAANAELPGDAETMAAEIRSAIEARDYERFEELVLWRDVGKIKKRVVAFQIRRGLGREIESVTLEGLDPNTVQQMLADGRHKLNMPVNQKVRVVYAEAAINEAGKKPTSVFLIGKHKDAYRIGLVVRNVEDDDDD
jgi:hypothetical protein